MQVSCFCEGHRCLRSSGTPRPKSLSSLRGYRVDPLVLAQCPTWALTLTGDWIKSGAEDGFWWFMKVYGSLRVWRVWCVWCVWCDWCVLTRTLLWQYDAVWIRAGLYSMAVRRALDMRLAIFSRRSEGLHWSANIKNRKRSGVFQLLLGQPQACPGYSSLLYSPAVKDIDASAAVARPAQRASATSVDTVWIHWFWRSAQHEPWHSQETGLNQGLRMVSDGLWRFMVVYVFDVFDVYDVYDVCDVIAMCWAAQHGCT